MMNLMSTEQFNAALKDCRQVFGFVAFQGDEGVYVKIQKTALEGHANGFSTIKAELTNCGNLYIN